MSPAPPPEGAQDRSAQHEGYLVSCRAAPKANRTAVLSTKVTL